MIPKRIFYVWLGENKLSNHALQCIQSWRRHMPNYELILINECSHQYFNFAKELKSSKWFRTVYKRKLWSLASDYIRYKVLYDHGGVYFDTDIEALKDITPLLPEKAGFIAGREMENIGSAVLAGKKGHWFLKYVLDYHVDQIWKDPVCIVTQIMRRYLEENYGVKVDSIHQKLILKDIILYPLHYFYPVQYIESFSSSLIKEDTYLVHWWNLSWVTPKDLRWIEHDRLNPNFDHSYFYPYSDSIVCLPTERQKVHLKKIFWPLLTLRTKNGNLYYRLFDRLRILKIRYYKGYKYLHILGIFRIKRKVPNYKDELSQPKKQIKWPI